MIRVGIEAMNAYGGIAYLDVMELARHRQLDTSKIASLLVEQKTVAMPYEDPVSFGVNAAKPLIDSLCEAEKDRIELLISCTQCGIDFGKSVASYIHDYLGLNRNCRLFEVKQACYSGTAGFQMAVSFVLSQVSPGAKALVVVSDLSPFAKVEPQDILSGDWSFAEPSGGAGAVAILVSENPHVFQVDVGANGYYSYEVTDVCAPGADIVAGDADLSILSYLDCCEQAFLEYQKRVGGVSYRESFQYLAFHTPLGGLVKLAHGTMLRKMARASAAEIAADFEQRVMPGIAYAQRVGNIMGATVFLALASTIDEGRFESPKRIGCFSYGAGCCSEFFSGVVTAQGQEQQKRFGIKNELNERYQLSIDEYEALLTDRHAAKFGARNVAPDHKLIPGVLALRPARQRLFLQEIEDYRRIYGWHDYSDNGVLPQALT